MSTTEIETLRSRVILARQARKLNQSELAELANVNQSQISKLESGTLNDPSLSLILDISKVLDIAVETLLNDNADVFIHALAVPKPIEPGVEIREDIELEIDIKDNVLVIGQYTSAASKLLYDFCEVPGTKLIFDYYDIWEERLQSQGRKYKKLGLDELKFNPFNVNHEDQIAEVTLAFDSVLRNISQVEFFKFQQAALGAMVKNLRNKKTKTLEDILENQSDLISRSKMIIQEYVDLGVFGNGFSWDEDFEEEFIIFDLSPRARSTNSISQNEFIGKMLLADILNRSRFKKDCTIIIGEADSLITNDYLVEKIRMKPDDIGIIALIDNALPMLSRKEIAKLEDDFKTIIATTVKHHQLKYLKQFLGMHFHDVVDDKSFIVVDHLKKTDKCIQLKSIS